MKTQILKFELHEDKNGKVQPVYCPYTGKKLSSEDPHDESINELNYPNSVVMVWAGDSISFDEPFYSHPDLNLSDAFLNEIDSIQECALKLDDLAGSNGYILVKIDIYGHMPGDFGSLIYLLGRSK